MKEADLVLQTLVRDHEFQGDFYCLNCGKPRACHARDGFVPNNSPSRLSTDPRSSYRGHPYWSRPGTIRLSKEESARIDFLSKRHIPLRSTVATITPTANAAAPLEDRSKRV